MKTIIITGLCILFLVGGVIALDQDMIKAYISNSLTGLYQENVSANDITVLPGQTKKANIISNHTIIDFEFNGQITSLITSNERAIQFQNAK